MLNLSAASNTIDHGLLLIRLRYPSGLQDLSQDVLLPRRRKLRPEEPKSEAHRAERADTLQCSWGQPVSAVSPAGSGAERFKCLEWPLLAV